jgi:hypothetical protein
MIEERTAHPFRAFAGAVALALVACALALAITVVIAAFRFGVLA